VYLTSVLYPHYSQSVREEGERLYRRQQVRLEGGDRWHAEGEIVGADAPEQVSLSRLSDVLNAKCTCDTYIEYGGCAHIWAVAMAAERSSFLLGSFGGTRLHLRDKPDPELARHQAGPKTPAWMGHIRSLAIAGQGSLPAAGSTRERSVFYCLSPSYGTRGLNVAVTYSEKKLNGDWGKVREGSFKPSEIDLLPEGDREILGIFGGIRSAYSYASTSVGGLDASGKLLERVLATAGDGQLLWGNAKRLEAAAPVTFDRGGVWRCHLVVRKEASEFLLAGEFRRAGEEPVPMANVRHLTEDGFAVTAQRVLLVETGPALTWLRELRARGPVRVPWEQGETFAQALLDVGPAAEVEWPDELRIESVRLPFTPRLRFREPKLTEPVRGVLNFVYGDRVVDGESATPGAFLKQPRQFLVRDRAGEEAARALLGELGLKSLRYAHEVVPVWEVSPKRFPHVVTALVQKGWTVESEGKVMRASTGFKIEISSGIDWFGIKGGVDFGGERVELPELLKAIQRGEKIVRLGDGTFGMLPEDLLKRYGVLLEMGDAAEGEIRYRKAQAGVLDVFLAELPEITTDELFEKARREIQSFGGVEPRQEPRTFQGTLRDYQRQGLGWMDFLRRYGFGGCLADDMGVGKTPQVLAQLESVRGKGASLAVVPRSLIYNWKEEAARFTPKLRILDYSDAARQASFDDYDLVLTTYGILRRDALTLREHEFEYVILDEGQAIKNAASESAKAARLLRARHRLVLSGTPIENHLGELWSLFEFLNPGMLGASRVFHSLAGRNNNPNADDTRLRISQAVRPFLLRRTKKQVARELPERIEQTIHCELDDAQRTLYNELRDHYRAKLLQKLGKGGLAKSKMQVLEALLRLRQAACHPALIDKKYAKTPSAKLDALMDQLEQVREEGSRALVFSQFTSMLALVQDRLAAGGMAYCYLDGKTKDREAVVKQFQADDGPGLFLISLKAGGVGLNLTAAEYVFLLDPWWNPAAEAQAIDRAHRIGQARTVFAYRLIAKETVEEHVLELQKNKRELADAILGEDNRLIGNLSREDLELLLS